MGNWEDASRHSDLALAIAHAEGFGIKGAIPTKAHNPGDLVLGDKGHGTLGKEGITVFADDATGWAALDHQVDLIRRRKSHVYTPDMSITHMAQKWTNTQQPEWAENVATYLKMHGRSSVTINTLLKDVL